MTVISCDLAQVEVMEWTGWYLGLRGPKRALRERDRTAVEDVENEIQGGKVTDATRIKSKVKPEKSRELR